MKFLDRDLVQFQPIYLLHSSFDEQPHHSVRVGELQTLAPHHIVQSNSTIKFVRQEEILQLLVLVKILANQVAVIKAFIFPVNSTLQKKPVLLIIRVRIVYPEQSEISQTGVVGRGVHLRYHRVSAYGIDHRFIFFL